MNFFRKASVILLLVFLILSFIAQGVFAAETIKIGYLAALTGDWAAYG